MLHIDKVVSLSMDHSLSDVKPLTVLCHSLLYFMINIEPKLKDHYIM